MLLEERIDTRIVIIQSALDKKIGPASPLKPGLTSSIVKRLGIKKTRTRKKDTFASIIS
jgi:hypothetical protein